ncbi:MAG TPA: 50S ribosomal protein L10 [Dehalococcoidia bacterium]|nr:50S ribosomal protein L10 [Dehalococcoidia bacterium]
MPTEKKVQAVAELTEVLSRSTVVIGAEYRGLRVEETTALRRQLRDAGIEMHVIKNTLFLRAANAAGKPELAALADGPTALVIGFDDPIAPLRAVVEYQRGARNTFAARNAYLEGQVFAGNQLGELATLPSRETMIAQFAGMIQSPITELVYLLQATVQEFFGLIEARMAQVDDGSLAAASAPVVEATAEPEAAAEPESVTDEAPAAEAGESEAMAASGAEAEAPAAEAEPEAASEDQA